MGFADRHAGSTGESPRRSIPDPRRLAAIGPLLGLVGVAAIAVAAYANRFASADPAIVRPALYLGGAIVIVGGLGCFAAFWNRRLSTGLAILVGAAAAVLMVTSYGRILAEPTRSYAQLAREIESRAPGAVLVCYPRYVQSLPFYCRRRVILVGAKTELAYGADHAADGSKYFFTTRADLMRLWNEPQPTLLVIDRWALPPLRQVLAPYQVIASDGKKLAIIRAKSNAGTNPN
jgi:hypothetical protein